ncbi:RNA-directed DNA polymerase, eukaryota [Tanacetum coccineum]
MEGLQCALSNAVSSDDVIITTEWSTNDLDNIILVFQVFYLALGLRINIHKSNIYGIGVLDEEVSLMANNSGCVSGSLPITYLRRSTYSHQSGPWSRVIVAVHGSSSHPISAAYNSLWGTIIKEVKALNDKGINLVSHCKIRVGNGLRTSFWNDLWIGDNQLKLSFPRLFALEVNKDCSVADKLNAPFTASFRRQTRGGPEAQQLEQLTNLLDSVSLSNMEDRCFWDLNGEGVFQVKDVRSVLDETFLPKENIPTRWVKSIPIKVNVFVWKLVQDRIPTRLNLMSRNIFVPSVECPVCNNDSESSSHLFFGCQVAKEVLKLICRWWDLVLYDFDNYDGWLLWNQLLFASSKPRKSFIFDDIVFRSFNCVLLVVSNKVAVHIKAVLGSLGIYFLSDVRKLAWIKWHNVLSSFNKGGLNIDSLKSFNLALLQTWRWRIFYNPQYLWVKVIKALHGYEGGFCACRGYVITYSGGTTASSDYRVTSSGPQETGSDYRDAGSRILKAATFMKLGLR